MNFIRTSYRLVSEQQSIPCEPQINILLLTYVDHQGHFSAHCSFCTPPQIPPVICLIGLLASTQSRLVFTNMIKVCVHVYLKSYKLYAYLFYMYKPLKAYRLKKEVYATVSNCRPTWQEGSSLLPLSA